MNPPPTCPKMKRKLALLIGSLCLLAGSGQAAELSRYAEFARAYGVVRYFSPNPYTEKWSESDWMKVCTLLASRIDTQPLEQVFRPLAPTLVFSEEPTPPRSADTPDAPRDITATAAPENCTFRLSPGCSPPDWPGTSPITKGWSGRRPAGHLGSATARNILHLPGGGRKVPTYPARPAQRAVRRPGDAPPARRGEKLLGQPPKCGQGTLPAAQFHFRTASR